ncbi:MAG: MFS transporter [Chloroflexota bacterium]
MGDRGRDQLLLVLATPLAVMVAMLNFAPLLPLMREEFGLSNAWAGALASATILSHTLLQLPSGYLADRIGGKRTVESGLVLVGLAVIASGLAPSFGILLLSRFVLGAGTATVFIAGLSCINGLVAAEKRVVAQGYFGAASNMGVLLVLLLSQLASGWGGWRGTFLIEGVAILLLAWLFSARMHPDGKGVRAAPASWGEILREPPLYLLGLAHVLGYGAFTGLAAWIATFLWQQHGISLQWAGPLAAFMPASSVVARTLGGALSVRRERQVIVVSVFATAVGLLLLPMLPSTPLVLLDLLLLGWFASMPFGAIFSYIPLVSPKGASGRGFSLVNFVGNVGALAFPPAIGYALDATGSFALGFGLLAAVGWSGAVAVALWLPLKRMNH